MFSMEPSGRLSRMRPMASIPTTRAATSQRLRRLCVNIEANGCSYPPVRKRRRRLVNTITMPMPSMMYSSPYEQMLWNCHDICGEQQHPQQHQQMERLSSGQDYSIFHRTEMLANENGHISNSSQATLCDDSPRQESRYSIYDNKSITQNTINELKSIVEALERNMQNEEESKVEPEPRHQEENESSQSSQLDVLTHLMRETNAKLDAYIANQLEQQAVIMSSNPLMQMNLMGKLKGCSRQRRNLSVLPLFVQTLPPAAPTSALPPLTTPPNPTACPLEGNDSFNSRQRQYRATPPRGDARRRRRPLRPAYIHLENRSCSTDDLEILPRILLARSPAGNEASTPNLRDCGTTMWCPMKCCPQHFCGLSPTDGKRLQPLEEQDKKVTPVPYPKQPSPRTIETTILYEDNAITTPPPLPKTPPPPRDRVHHEKDYEVVSRNYDYDGSSSSSSSSHELSFTSYIENRREFDLHDWYNNLEVIEHYFRARKPNVQTSNKQLQTDIESTSSTTSTSDIHHIIATTDKAVSTTEFQMKHINIVSQCKSSSLKPQRPNERKGNQKPLNRSQIKVKFEEVKPKVANVGTNPMLESSSMQMPILQQRRGQRLNTPGETLDRKTAGKQEESIYHLPPYKGYPTCWKPIEVPEKRICRCKHCIFRKPETVPWPEALDFEMAGKQKEPVKPIEEEFDAERRSTIASTYSITTNDELDKPRGTSIRGASPQEHQHHQHHQHHQPTILLVVVNKPAEGYPGQLGCPGRCNPAGPPNFYNHPPPPGYGYGYNRTRYDPGYRDNRPPPFGAAYPDDGRGPNPNDWYQYGNARPGNSPYGANGQPGQGRTPDNYCRCLPTGGASRKRCGCKDEAAAKRRVCQCEAPPPSPPPEKVVTPPRTPPPDEPEPPLETKQMGQYRCVSVPICIAHGKPACCDCCECDDQDDEDLEEQESTCCCNNLDKCICMGPQGRQKPPVCECNMTELERQLRHLMPNMECICFKEKPKKKRKKRKPPPRKIYDRFANPPYVLEPKSCCLNRCRTICCQPTGTSCYTQSYGGGCSPW